MRVGCLGCAVLIGLFLGLGFLLGGGLVLSTAIFNVPERVPTSEWTAWDGQRAQQKMVELLRRDAGKSARAYPLVFTEREINAFLARHLEESERVRFAPLVVELKPGGVVIHGKTRLKTLMRGIPFNYLADVLPASQLGRPVWVTIHGALRIEPGLLRRERSVLRLDPTRLRIGTQEASPWLLSRLMGSRLLRWSLPKVIEDVLVEEGRVTVITRAG